MKACEKTRGEWDPINEWGKEADHKHFLEAADRDDRQSAAACWSASSSCTQETSLFSETSASFIMETGGLALEKNNKGWNV